MKHALMLSILLLASQHATAKCRADFFTFSGTVADSSGKSVTGAVVGISWSEFEGVAGPVVAVSDSKGHYKIPLVFQTYSGKGTVNEDECNQRLRIISITAYKGKLRSPHQRIRIAQAKSMRLPTLKLWVEVDQKLPSVKLLEPRG